MRALPRAATTAPAGKPGPVLDPRRATAFRCEKDVVDGGLPLRPHRHQVDAIHPAAAGMPVSWCLAGPKLGEREAAADLPAHARETGALMMTELTRDRAGPRRLWLATLSDRIRFALGTAVERLMERVPAKVLCNGCFPGVHALHLCS